MISMLDFKAYALKTFFNLVGISGSSLLNLGSARGLDIFTNVRYGSDAEQCLDIFRPLSTRPGGLPVLVFFHGGGWVCGDKRIYKRIAATFSRSGFLTFNVNYRLAPRHKLSAQLEDATRAIDWIYANASHYGGDRSRIVLAGDSAGAQIASWYASALQNPNLFREIGIPSLASQVSVRGLLLFYGVYDFDTVLDADFPFIRVFARSFLGADSHGYARNAKPASPIRQVSGDLPPAWICAGERDGLFDQSRAYARALESRGVRCRTLFFANDIRANHGFLFFPWLRSSKAAFASSLVFLRELVETDR